MKNTKYDMTEVSYEYYKTRLENPETRKTISKLEKFIESDTNIGIRIEHMPDTRDFDDFSEAIRGYRDEKDYYLKNEKKSETEQKYLTGDKEKLLRCLGEFVIVKEGTEKSFHSVVIYILSEQIFDDAVTKSVFKYLSQKGIDCPFFTLRAGDREFKYEVTSCFGKKIGPSELMPSHAVGKMFNFKEVGLKIFDKEGDRVFRKIHRCNINGQKDSFWKENYYFGFGK